VAAAWKSTREIVEAIILGDELRRGRRFGERRSWRTFEVCLIAWR
jgi:hypothetical protein